jgi:hypothetical protein
MNNGVVFWASGCESWCVILSQWLWIMVCYAEPVVVNHGVLDWASGCESWCAMLGQWLLIILLSITHHQSQPLAQHYTPWLKTTGPAKCTIIHNHWLISFIANCSAWHTITQTQSAQYKTTWFTTVRFSIAHMIHNHWVSITHHDSQPLAQHYRTWLTATRSDFESRWALLYLWLLIMVCIAEQVIMNHGEFTVSMAVNDGVLCWVSGCELCCAMLVNHD